MKEKISIDEQIDHMKAKGIKFDICSEEDAKLFLRNNTYYFKFKSYSKAFEKKKDGTYINVDFEHIKELSKLDAHLRQFIFKLAINTEHMLKTKLINDVTENIDCDGYYITESFLHKYEYVQSNIDRMKKDSASGDLIHKYNGRWPIWAITEVLSFGDFIKLYTMYYEIYSDKKNQNELDLLVPLKFLRNAAAHNNCLLNSLRIPYGHTHLSSNNSITKTSSLQQSLSHIKGIGKVVRKKKMSNPIVHDFVASLFLFDLVCSSVPIKEDVYLHLDKLFKEKMIKHKDYFEKDTVLCSYYEFLIKIIDYLKNGRV